MAPPTPSHPACHARPTEAACNALLQLQERLGCKSITLPPGRAQDWKRHIITSHFQGSPFEFVSIADKIGYQGRHKLEMAIRRDPVAAFLSHATKPSSTGDNDLALNFEELVTDDGTEQRVITGFCTADRCREMELALAEESELPASDCKCIYFVLWSDKVGFDGGSRHIGHPVTLTAGAWGGLAGQGYHQAREHRANAPSLEHGAADGKLPHNNTTPANRSLEHQRSKEGCFALGFLPDIPPCPSESGALTRAMVHQGKGARGPPTLPPPT